MFLIELSYKKPHNTYKPDQEVEGLEKLLEPSLCCVCFKLAHHAIRVKLGEGYKDVIMPICSEECDFNMMLG